MIRLLFFLRIAMVVLMISSSATTGKAQENTTENTSYRNPVIPGEIPDPSIIRVGETYYAVGTSFDFAPTYPIYKSNDLVNWKQLGAVFREPPVWASKNFWAPELFVNDGIFYMYYTAKRKDNGIACIGVATTKDITKGFTDHGILIEWGEEAIDAFVFKDDDDKRYITWKAYGLTEGRPIEILGSELSPDGLQLVGEHFTLTDPNKGWRPGNDEGQCIVKHQGYYYMLYSDGGCCDNKCDYRIVVSRSKYVKSGWEQLPEPILEGGEAWRCPGHGTLVTVPDGRYFYLYHAYHATDFEYIGRQGMLDELAWDDKTGWPYMVNGRNPTTTASTPFTNTSQKRKMVHDDYFGSEKELEMREWDLLFPRPKATLEDGTLTIRSSHKGYNFIGFRPEVGNYSFQTQVAVTKNSSGIGIYTNQQKMLALAAENGKVVVYKVEDSIAKIVAEQPFEGATVFLKYKVSDGKYMQYYWSMDAENWNSIPIKGEPIYDATFLATWGFSPRAGFIVDGNSNGYGTFSNTKVVYTFGE